MSTMTARDLGGDALRDWVVAQRWFGSKARDVVELNVLELLALRDGLSLGLVEARFAAGTHELYQLLVRDDDLDAVTDPALARLFRERATIEGEHGRISFRWLDDAPALSEDAGVRALSAEQSNSSVLLDGAHVLKLFRRLEPGHNPELEMLRFLHDHGFDSVPTLHGWCELRGDVLDATLSVAQEFVAGARDGWDHVLDALGAEPERLLPTLRDLGTVCGQMHTVLGSDPTNPDFASEEPSVEALSLLTATIDEEIERVFVGLPDHSDLAPIMGRGEEIRDRLQLMANVGSGGRLIRHHGDLHLGQTLLAGERWVVLDFEGEPARSLRERRRKRSPLRDAAGMLRSFAYAASSLSIQRGVEAPEGWEERAREAYLEGYLEAVDSSLLPAGQAATRTLLSIFELEKAVYELSYELNNRPEWVPIPVAGIARLLEEPIGT
jgi:maltokinase